MGALVLPASAMACSCAPLGKRELIRQADAAFAGKLVRVAPRSGGRAAFRYRVRRVYKAGAGIRRGRLVTVVGARGSAACGLPRRRDRLYGLAVTRGESVWVGSSCGLLWARALRGCAS